jgi:hypothetical protein
MKRLFVLSIVVVLTASVGGCALFGSWWGPKRPAWRSQAERACLSSGAVKPSADVRPMGEIDGPGACGADRPFKVAAVGRRGRTPLNESTALNCPMVAAVDDWVDRVVQPEAEARFGQPVVGIEHMGSYNCRRIAGVRQMSEHAYMNALDVSGFKLADGRTVRVKGGWKSADLSERDFLNAVGAEACDDFTTVLGPDAGAAHYDHLHLDLARHAKGRHVCKGGSSPAPAGGRMFSFFGGGPNRTGSIPESGSEDGLGEDEEFDDGTVFDR